MPAYVIINVDVRDQEQYAKYMKAGAPTILAHGGKPLVRGEKTEVWEGDPDPRRVIMLEFKDMQAARDWWNSSDYKEAKKLRLRAASADVFCVEGME